MGSTRPKNNILLEEEHKLALGWFNNKDVRMLDNSTQSISITIIKMFKMLNNSIQSILNLNYSTISLPQWA